MCHSQLSRPQQHYQTMSKARLAYKPRRGINEQKAKSNQNVFVKLLEFISPEQKIHLVLLEPLIATRDKSI